MFSGASAGAETGWRLPVELLLQCLMAADMSSRIRASHVSHVWREAALAERRLWDGFSCDYFRDKLHEEAMFALLQAMLLRSRSLPFDLEIPYRYDGTDIEYRDRLLGLEAFDICRLVAYRGPARIFRLLNPSLQPLPALLRVDRGRGNTEHVKMDAAFSSHCLPKLQHIDAYHISFPMGGSPFFTLTSITSAGANSDFFTHCPHLSRLEITNTYMGTPLPAPQTPLSLQTIVVRCQRPRALDFVELMEGWRGIPIRRIVAHEIYSLRGVLAVFLASHTHPMELRLPSHDHAAALAALPGDKTLAVLDAESETVWTINPSPPWAADLLSSIEKPASERLTAISVSLARLGALFRGQLHVPGLERLEICLGSTAPADASEDPPVQSGEEFFLRAPRLRTVIFNFDDDYTHSLSARHENIRHELGTLRECFRTLIQYDTDLLDAIFVSRHLEHECAGFSNFAREYILVGRGA